MMHRRRKPLYVYMHLKRIHAVFYSLLISLFLSGLVAGQCLEYEPKTVSLSGTLVRETYPGRANDESSANGNESAVVWILKLKAAICVTSTDEKNESVNGETEVQLVLDKAQYNNYQNMLGKSVTVTGKLFYWHSVYHYKQLLLTTTEIKINA